jgi:hypothetical protein
MKVKRPLPREISDEQRRELIVSTWRALGGTSRETSGETSVGATELIAIQKALAEVVGEDQAPGPASIARELAQEGAELRHPEVIECDAAWRAARWEREAKRFKRVGDLISVEPLTMKRAEELIAELDRLRQEFASSNDDEGLARLKEFAFSAQQRSESLAKSGLDAANLAEQTEIAAWLKVWIQTPAIFNDWLQLRKRSAEFGKKFHGD